MDKMLVRFAIAIDLCKDTKDKHFLLIEMIQVGKDCKEAIDFFKRDDFAEIKKKETTFLGTKMAS